MNKILREVISWVVVLAIAFILAFGIRRFIIFTVNIPSSSMENTLLVDDRVMISRLSYLIGKPERGDIIVFPFPDNEELDYIKRIIGLPGEQIQGINGLVYINGEALEEGYVKETIDHDFGPFEVPEDSYFMMGDNRNNSEDSRYWSNSFLNKDKIKGKAILKYPDFTWLN